MFEGIKTWWRLFWWPSLDSPPGISSEAVGVVDLKARETRIRYRELLEAAKATKKKKKRRARKLD